MQATDKSSGAKVERLRHLRRSFDMSGWKLGIQNEDLMAEPSIFLYLQHHPSGWRWMCSIPKAKIDALEGVFHDLSANELSHAIESLSKAVRSSEGAERDEELLGIVLGGYLSKTDTFKKAERGEAAAHFFIVYYSQSNSIRPSAFAANPKFPATVGMVDEIFHRVLEYDSQNHPAWVKGR